MLLIRVEAVNRCENLPIKVIVAVLSETDSVKLCVVNTVQMEENVVNVLIIAI